MFRPPSPATIFIARLELTKDYEQVKIFAVDENTIAHYFIG